MLCFGGETATFTRCLSYCIHFVWKHIHSSFSIKKAVLEVLFQGWILFLLKIFFFSCLTKSLFTSLLVCCVYFGFSLSCLCIVIIGEIEMCFFCSLFSIVKMISRLISIQLLWKSTQNDVLNWACMSTDYAIYSVECSLLNVDQNRPVNK